jgi:shikimate kinase
MVHPQRVYIIGFMGSGKSTAGKKLAAMKGWDFIDLDNKIQEETSSTIEQIFSEKGEQFFRDIESEKLTGLKTDKNTVISVGGGTPCFKDNMDFMLRTGIVIYLRMTPAQLKSRLDGASSTRPLIRNLKDVDLLDFISSKLKEREEYYMRASLIIDGLDLNIRNLSNLLDT